MPFQAECPPERGEGGVRDLSDDDLRVFDGLRNKYELVLVAAREARRINSILHYSGEQLKEKVTLRALRKALNSEVKFYYEDSREEK